MTTIPMRKLTPGQTRALTMARDQGHAFADISVRDRMGGAYRRMVIRLGDDGFLTKSAPYRITAKGRQALLKQGGAA